MPLSFSWVTPGICLTCRDWSLTGRNGLGQQMRSWLCTHEKQPHNSGSRIMIKCSQGSFSWKSCLCLTLLVLMRGLWQQPKEGHTDFCCSPACSVQATVLLHADAEPLSKKGQFASRSLHLFAVSVILSQDQATFRLIFVSVHLWGAGGGVGRRCLAYWLSLSWGSWKFSIRRFCLAGCISAK